MFESKGALVRKVWRFIIACLQLITDREIYTIVWLTARSYFVRSPHVEIECPKVERPKSRAARNAL